MNDIFGIFSIRISLVPLALFCFGLLFFNGCAASLSGERPTDDATTADDAAVADTAAWPPPGQDGGILLDGAHADGSVAPTDGSTPAPEDAPRDTTAPDGAGSDLAVVDAGPAPTYGPASSTTGIPPSFARTFDVSSAAELKSVIPSLLPGDAVLVADGTHDWGTVIWGSSASGSSSDKIYLLPKNPGKAVFTKSTYFRLQGKHLVLAGFTFRDTSDSCMRIEGDHGRVAHNLFLRTGSAASSHNKALGVYASFVEVDNNTFDDAYGISIWVAKPSVQIYKNHKTNKRLRVHHNAFVNIKKRASNGGEAIMLGYSYAPLPSDYDDDIEATIEDNLFSSAQGDPEVISIKSSRNVIRNNCFRNNGQGGLVVRNGDNNLITGNWVANSAQSAIRISGEGNHFVFNYVDRVASSSGYAISLHHLNCENGACSYRSGNDNVIEQNVFNHYAYAIRSLYSVGKALDSPKGNSIRHNTRYAPSNKGYIDSSGVWSETKFRAANTWNSNTYATTTISTDPPCGTAGLFNGNSKSVPGNSKLLGSPTTIHAPSWW